MISSVDSVVLLKSIHFELLAIGHKTLSARFDDHRRLLDDLWFLSSLLAVFGITLVTSALI